MLKINVTKACINQGYACNGFVCPIAQAINKLSIFDYVLVLPKRVRLKIADRITDINLPRSAIRFINKLDKNHIGKLSRSAVRSTRPFSFKIDVKNAVWKKA